MKTLKEEVSIEIGKIALNGSLAVPENAIGIVAFAHGSGSSRFSPRNNYVAEYLQKHKLATLLVDLLTEEEEQIDLETGELRFNIQLLAVRLIGIASWLKKNSRTKSLNIGLFGSSTGAAAALIAAAKLPVDINVVVSRGGRPDLASSYLPKINVPTLFIVGGNDLPVIKLNKSALLKLHCTKKLEIIPDAAHLFEEPGKLEKVAKLAAGWLAKYLS